jgi:hypothetical protein
MFADFMASVVSDSDQGTKSALLIGLLCFSQLVGCAGGEAIRWVNPEYKLASVEDIPYDVF